MSGTPDVRVTTSGTWAGTARYTTASRPEPERKASGPFLALSLAQNWPRWRTLQKGRPFLTFKLTWERRKALLFIVMSCHHSKSDCTLKYQFLVSVERSCLVTLGSNAPKATSRWTWEAAAAPPLKRSIRFPVATIPTSPHHFNSLDFLPGHTPVGITNSTATTYGENIKTIGLFNVVNLEKEMYLCICTLFVFFPLTIYVTMNSEFKWGHLHEEETNPCLLIQERRKNSLGKEVILFTLFFK